LRRLLERSGTRTGGAAFLADAAGRSARAFDRTAEKPAEATSLKGAVPTSFARMKIRADASRTLRVTRQKELEGWMRWQRGQAPPRFAGSAKETVASSFPVSGR
jgi:hypothetical protein